MKILVTGASGQIGANLIDRWEGEAVGVDRNPQPWPISHDRLEFVHADLMDPNWHESINWDDIDFLVHFAAYAKVHELVVEPRKALENIQVLYNALEVARDKKLPFLFSSSREVYGNIQERDRPIDEDDYDLMQESPYSASKLSGEAMVHGFANCYDMKCGIIRFSNVYGRFDNDLERMERVIPLFFKKIANDEPIEVYGPEKTLDFTYVADAVAGIKSAIRHVSEKMKPGSVETFNLAYGSGHSLRELVMFISEAVGKVPDVSWQKPRVGEVCWYVADIDHAKTWLDFDPQVSLREGIQKTAQWYRETGFIS